jgi:hypothetical protein
VGLVVVERQLGERPHGPPGVEVVDVQRLLEPADPGVRPLQDGDVETLLGAEVVVDHPLRRAGLGGDLVHPATGVPPAGELLGRGVEDLRAGPLGIALPFRRHVFGRGSGHASSFVQRLRP